MSTLTLKRPKLSQEQAIDLSLQTGFRFIDRKGRYILQAQMVEICSSEEGQLTWVDVPLCPEIYGPTKL